MMSATYQLKTLKFARRTVTAIRTTATGMTLWCGHLHTFGPSFGFMVIVDDYASKSRHIIASPGASWPATVVGKVMKDRQEKGPVFGGALAKLTRSAAGDCFDRRSQWLEAEVIPFLVLDDPEDIVKEEIQLIELAAASIT